MRYYSKVLAGRSLRFEEWKESNVWDGLDEQFIRTIFWPEIYWLANLIKAQAK